MNQSVTNKTNNKNTHFLRSNIVISILLIITAFLFNHWSIGALCSPTGKVEAFETKFFIWLFQALLLLAARLVWLKGGSSLGRKHLLFSFITLVFSLVVVELFVHISTSILESRKDEKKVIDERMLLSLYSGRDWARQLFEETRKAYSRRMYQSYYLWTRREYHGKYVNIDSTGMRKTWNPGNSHGEPSRELYVFGGSTVWGTGARDEHTIPSYLSKILHKNGYDYKVFNYGESAYIITQEFVRLMMLLREGKRPDLVVFYDGANDVSAAYKTGISGVDMQYRDFQKRLVKQTPPKYTLRQDIYLAVTGILANHCKTYQLISKAPELYRAFVPKTKGSKLQRKKDSTLKRTIFIEEAAKIDAEGLEKLAEGIVSYYVESTRLIDHLAQAYGFEYILFWQPVLFTETHANEEEATIKRFSDRSLGFLYEEVYERMKSRKIKNFHDISNVLNNRTDTIYIDFCHLSEEGNEMIACRIFETLENALQNKSKPITKVVGKASAKEVGAEKNPLRGNLRPAFLHLTMDAASPIVLDASEGQHNQVFRDPSGNPNTDAHSVPGVVGTALAFDGVDDSIVIPAAQVSHIFAAGTVTDFTVAFWWRSDSDPFPDGYREILRNYTPDKGGIILYQRGNAEGTSKRIYMNFYVAGNGAPVLGPSTKVAENIGQWHHYVFQREGSMLRAWCDGALQGSQTDPVVRESMGSGNDFHINSFRVGAKGAMDDFRVYDRALTQSEIEALAIAP